MEDVCNLCNLIGGSQELTNLTVIARLKMEDACILCNFEKALKKKMGKK